MIRFKKGVEVEGITKECIHAICEAGIYFNSMLGKDAVVTSVSDGVHSKNSKHYEGNAFDLRTWTTETSGVQMSPDVKAGIAIYLADKLGGDYDVVVEKTHIHIEYDPQ